MKTFKIAALVTLILALCAGLYVGGTILYATITDYQPPERQDLSINGKGSAKPDSLLSFMIWNIGYAGLGKDVDFFYDGGETVHPPQNKVEHYFNGIQNLINRHDSLDFFLFQEVDTQAARSHGKHLLNGLSKTLDEYPYSYATNYSVNYIPIPLTNPLGHVQSGLASFSRFEPESAVRYSFPVNYNWPNSVFFLDRCFLVQRFPLQADKELVVINTHNSAYDKGELKRKEMGYLKQFLLKEYHSGNYVVVGGDWNQYPPGFNPEKFVDDIPDHMSLINIKEDYLPDWQWVYDPSVPTNRSLQAPYDKDTTFKSSIDFYLLSPNLQLKQVEAINLNFAYSDHQPVVLRTKLK